MCTLPHHCQIFSCETLHASSFVLWYSHNGARNSVRFYRCSVKVSTSKCFRHKDATILPVYPTLFHSQTLVHICSNPSGNSSFGRAVMKSLKAGSIPSFSFPNRSCGECRGAPSCGKPFQVFVGRRGMGTIQTLRYCVTICYGSISRCIPP